MPSRTRSRAAAVAVAALVVLAGCGALGGGDGGDPVTTTPAVGNGTAIPGDADAATVKQHALAAMRNTSAYTLDATVARTVTQSGRTQTITVNSTGEFDRGARALRLNQTVSSRLGQRVSSATYLVDGTLYARSPQNEQQHGSAWIRQDLSDPERVWNQTDTLYRQQALLAAANVTLAGSETVSGVETRVLDLDVSSETYAELVSRSGFGGANVTVTNASFTLYVAESSGQLVRATGTVASEVATASGRTTVSEELRLRFGYGSVSVDLPAAARDAPRVGTTTSGNTTTTAGTTTPGTTTGTTAAGNATTTTAGNTTATTADGNATTTTAA